MATNVVILPIMAKNDPAPETNIRKLRKERGMTQAELSERSGFSEQDISRFETGTRPLTLQK